MNILPVGLAAHGLKPKIDPNLSRKTLRVELKINDVSFFRISSAQYVNISAQMRKVFRLRFGSIFGFEP
jgi:hypothetical protein